MTKVLFHIVLPSKIRIGCVLFSFCLFKIAFSTVLSEKSKKNLIQQILRFQDKMPCLIHMELEL